MLTLFAILGVTFVLYSDAEATSARIAREAEDLANTVTIDLSAQQALFMFLGQLIYDLPDNTQAGVSSALRGQSLGRLIYGYNPQGQDDKPYTGVGRLHYPSPLPMNGTYARDDTYWVNYTYNQADNFLRDPEHPGTRANFNAAYANPYTGGF